MHDPNTGPVRAAMVGGGEGAFIGNVHRMGMRLDGAWQLVAGAFSSDPENCRRTGASLGLDAGRCYGDWREMLRVERELPANERAECVVIVTPNHLHYPVASAALAAGFHVMSDKPATRTLAEAEALASELPDTGRLYGLTHTYLGYPMVAELRHLVRSGAIGRVRKVYVEYPQGWLAGALETDGSKQAEWRTDPERSGAGGSIGDIGTHAFTLAEWAADLETVALCADLNTFVAGRRVDDDAAALLRFAGGASGVLTCSQVCAGEENSLKLRVYGELGGLEWQQLEPNTLLHRPGDGPTRVLRAGAEQPLCELALSRTRTPSGHPEGYLEAFANLYRDFAAAIRSGEGGTATEVPGIELGLRGMLFVERMIDSDRSDAKWIDFAGGGPA